MSSPKRRAAEKHYMKTRCVWPPAVTSKKHGSRVVIIMRSEERMDRVFGRDWQQTEIPAGKVNATDLNVPAANLSNYTPFDLTKNPPITVLGKYKAILTARAVQNRNLAPKMIVSSPALRCVETAAAIASFFKISIGIEPGLSDHPGGTIDFGLQYLTETFNISSEYRPVLDALPQKEEEKAVEKRVHEVLKALMEKEHSRSLFIVAHGVAQHALSHMANGLSLDSASHTEMKHLEPVELGVRFPPGSVLTAVRSTEEPPHSYSILRNLVPPITYGVHFSNTPIPL